MGIVRMKASFFQARPKSQHEVWAEFFADAALLARQSRHRRRRSRSSTIFHHSESVTGTGDILFILSTIRWANREKGS